MDYETARKQMVDSQVRTNDVTDVRIQAALETVPREKFLPSELRVQAYADREVVYAPGRSLITARDFAKLLQAADIKPGDLVLDIGCGAGYSAAVAARLGEMVVAVESDEALAATAQEMLNGLDVINAAVVTGELAAGAAKQGPFDVILIAMAIEVEPTALLKQLKDGGRLVALLRDNAVAKGVVWTRAGSAWSRRTAFDAAARTVLPGFARAKAFVF